MSTVQIERNATRTALPRHLGAVTYTLYLNLDDPTDPSATHIELRRNREFRMSYESDNTYFSSSDRHRKHPEADASSMPWYSWNGQSNPLQTTLDWRLEVVIC